MRKKFSQIICRSAKKTIVYLETIIIIGTLK